MSTTSIDLTWSPPSEALAPTAMPPSPDHGHGPRNLLLLNQRQAGVRVNEDTALTLGAVFACVRVIGEGLACLPWQVFDRLPTGGRQLQPQDPADWLLHFQANPETSAFCWRETMIAHALLWGNGYAEIERDTAGRPVWLWQLTPERVTIERRNADMRNPLLYRVRNPQAADTLLDPGDVFHLKGLGWDGLQGYPVVRLAARAIGLGIALDEASASLMGHDSTPGGYLSHPGRLTDKARENLRDSWQRRHGGPSNRRTMAVLEEGLTWQQTGLAPEDMQLLAQRQYTPADICRWFRVQPHKIADLSRSTFSNIEQQSIEHVVDTLLPWARRLEAEADIKLFGRINRGTRITRINLLGLLRGDAASRSAFYTTLMDRGVFSINDVREQEDANPVPGGDLRTVQKNMQTLEQANAAAPPAVPGSPPVPGGAAPAPTTTPPAAGELIDLEDRRQTTPTTCGAAASWAVGNFFEVGPDTEDEWAALVGTTSAGTDPSGIMAAFIRLGMAVGAEQGMTLADLALHTGAGRPVICPVQYQGDPVGGERGGHYVTVIGCGLGMVFFQDPSFGRQMQEVEEFMARWHDVGADGAAYENFGIAVGEDLETTLPAAGEDEDELPTEPGGAEDDLPTGGPTEQEEEETDDDLEGKALAVLDRARRLCGGEGGTPGPCAEKGDEKKGGDKGKRYEKEEGRNQKAAERDVAADNRAHGRPVASLERPAPDSAQGDKFHDAHRVSVEGDVKKELGKDGERPVATTFVDKPETAVNDTHFYRNGRDKGTVYVEKGKTFVDAGTGDKDRRQPIHEADTAEQRSEKIRKVFRLGVEGRAAAGAPEVLRPVLVDILDRVGRREQHRAEDARKRLKTPEAIATWQGETAAERRQYAREALLPAVTSLATLAGSSGAAADVALQTFLSVSPGGGVDELIACVRAACAARAAT